MTREALDAAKAWSKEKGTKMNYAPFFEEKSFNLGEFLDVLKDPSEEKQLQFVRRLEKKTGKPVKRIVDPDVWQAKSITQMADLKANIKFSIEAVRKWGKPLFGGIADEGHVILPSKTRLQR